MIKRYELSNDGCEIKGLTSYGQFRREYRENIIKGIDGKGFAESYTIFNINNSTIILENQEDNPKSELTIGLNEKLINKTIKQIKSKGFELEEITR